MSASHQWSQLVSKSHQWSSLVSRVCTSLCRPCQSPVVSTVSDNHQWSSLVSTVSASLQESPPSLTVTSGLFSLCSLHGLCQSPVVSTGLYMSLLVSASHQWSPQVSTVSDSHQWSVLVSTVTASHRWSPLVSTVPASHQWSLVVSSSIVSAMQSPVVRLFPKIS